MSAYDKLRSISGNLKTLTSQKSGIAEDVNPFNGLEAAKIHFRKNAFDNEYVRTTNNGTSGGKKQFTISNSTQWVSSLSFSVFLPREDANGAVIHYKPLAILNLIEQVKISIGSTEIQKYNDYGLFNLLAQSNEKSVRDQLTRLATAEPNDAGTEFEATEEGFEINIPLPSIGTKTNYNNAPEDHIKKLPFPIGRCSGDLKVEIIMRELSDAVEGVEGAGTFLAPGAYDDLRVYYEDWVLMGQDGAVVDEKSAENSGEYLYQTYSIESLNNREENLSNSADTVVKIEDIREDGELLTVMVSCPTDADLAEDKYLNDILSKLQFRLGNNVVYDVDSTRGAPIQALNILRYNSAYQTSNINERFRNLYQCPLSADPMNWMSSVYYGANPDKKAMSLTLRSTDATATNHRIAVSALYRVHIRILPNGNVIKEFAPTY